MKMFKFKSSYLDITSKLLINKQSCMFSILFVIFMIYLDVTHALSKYGLKKKVYLKKITITNWNYYLYFRK